MNILYIVLWAYIHQLYIGKNGLKTETIGALLGRAMKAWFALNLCFYMIEVAIWGYGFPHYGDLILIAILTSAFFISVDIVLQLDRAREPSLKKMTA